MRRLILSFAILAGVSLPVYANDFQSNPIDYPKDYYSNHSMGCMLLQECKDGVVEITSIKTLEEYYDKGIIVEEEFQQLLNVINEVGSKVYLAPTEYFPRGHRGVYHTVSNHFYLNDAYMHESHILMSVMRHEGWHMAQDCMAGDINNNFIAVIYDENDIPQIWKDLTKRLYPKSVVPWEQEAMWVGKEKDMTVNALRACAEGEMWNHPDFPPTPLTRQFLVDQGFIKE